MSKTAIAGEAGDTKTLLLDVAEEQFGLHGLAGVSLREIARRAGCANTAAVRYHFGDRNGLVDAIFRDRLALMESARTELLAQTRAGSLQVPDLLEILLRPFERQRGRSGRRSYAAFLAGLARSGEISIWKQYGENLATTRHIIHALRHQTPALTDARFQDRMTILSVMVWNALADLDRTCADATAHPDIETGFRDLITMAAAALTVPERA